MADVERLTSACLATVPHGFLGRRGGVSTDIYAGLNVGQGSRDDPAAVRANRDIARDALAPGSTLVTVHQVHSAEVVTVTDSGIRTDRPKADAMVTDRPGLLLGILTADCVPVLLVDPAAGVVGAAHAGWKGAIGGIGEATIDAMIALGAARERIVAATGPSIGAASYEVSEAFAGPFLAWDRTTERFFVAGRPGHLLFDLPSYVEARLRDAGIGTVDRSREDTLGQPERFFSYRRACLAGEKDYGRQLSAIAVP